MYFGENLTGQTFFYFVCLFFIPGTRSFYDVASYKLQDEWRHLVAGGTHKPKELDNPAPEWISERSWNEILTLGALEKYAPFVDDFKNHLKGFKAIFDGADPHRY